MTEGVCVGIDVGARTKGFHAVALRGSQIVTIYESTGPASVAEWCVGQGAKFVAVDAPCKWSTTGRARAAERTLMSEQIWCFSSPTREQALEHPKNQFGWMLCGEELYKALLETHSLFNGLAVAKAPVVLETFPHAIACALAGRIVSAKRKVGVRRTLLRDEGIDEKRLRNIDYVDAALCALAARAVAIGSFRTYGDSREGFIVTPRSSHSQALH